MDDKWKFMQIIGLGSFNVKENLKRLKEQLNKWNKEVFGILDLNIEKIVKHLSAIEEMAANDEVVNVDQNKAIQNEF